MTIINKKYKIIEHIGSGSFGSIYKGQHIRSKEYVAIKVEPIDSPLKLLKNESIIYQYLKDCMGISTIKWFGKDDVNYYMVIELLGDSLQTLKHKFHTFSLSLVLKIGIKLLSLIKTIHEKGLVHRDLKPENCLFGVNKLNDLYIIDFGFCKSFLHNGQHISIHKTHNIIGSYNYASIMSHKHFALSRRDDLESIGYILLYLYIGELPWHNDMDEAIIIQKKTDIIHCKTYPSILRELITYSRSLEFEEKPNYYLLFDNFKRELELLSKTN